MNVQTKFETKVINCLCGHPNCHIIVKKDLDTNTTYIFYPIFHSHSTYNNPKPFGFLRRILYWILMGRDIEFHHDNLILEPADTKYLLTVDSSIIIDKHPDFEEYRQITEYVYFDKKNISWGSWFSYLYNGCLKFTLCKELHPDGTKDYYLNE